MIVYMRHSLRAWAISTAFMVSAFSAGMPTVAVAQETPTQLIILGAAAGRTSYGGHSHGGFSAAIAVGEDRYLIDFGRGWHDRYYKAGLGTAPPRPVLLGSKPCVPLSSPICIPTMSLGIPNSCLFGSTEGCGGEEKLPSKFLDRVQVENCHLNPKSWKHAKNY